MNYILLSSFLHLYKTLQPLVLLSLMPGISQGRSWSQSYIYEFFPKKKENQRVILLFAMLEMKLLKENRVLFRNEINIFIHDPYKINLPQEIPRTFQVIIPSIPSHIRDTEQGLLYIITWRY